MADGGRRGEGKQVRHSRGMWGGGVVVVVVGEDRNRGEQINRGERMWGGSGA